MTASPAAAPLRGTALTAAVLVWLGVLGPIAMALSTATFGATQSTGTARTGMLLLGGGLVVTAVTWLAAGVAVIGWLRHARAGAEALSAAPHRLAAGWAVGAWFVPVAGQWLPLVVVSDVARASSPTGGRPAALIPWWAAWTAGSILLPAAFVVQLASALNGRAAVGLFALLLAAAAVLLMIAAAAFTRLALQVAGWQDERIGASAA